MSGFPNALAVGLPLLLSGWVVSSASTLGAPTNAAFRLEKYQRYSTSDGLQQNTIQALHQSEDGYLWIGTRDGVLRYDGHQFVHLNDHADAGLLHGLAILDIEGAADGRILFLTHEQIVSFHEGVFQSVPLPAPLAEASLRAFSPAAAGGFYIADKFHVHRVTESDPLAVVWTLKTEITTATDLVENPDGSLFYATYTGLFRVRPGGEGIDPCFTYADGLKADTVNNLYRDDAGRLWVPVKQSKLWGGNSGLHRGTDTLHLIEQGTISQVALPVEVSNGQLSCFDVDHEGNRWVGTRYNGLFRFSPRLIRTFDFDDGLSSTLVRSVCVGQSGVVWIGTRDGLFEKSADGKFQRIFADYEYVQQGRNATVNSVFQSEDGRLWVGTENGAFVRTGNEFERRGPDPFGYFGEVYCFAESDSGTVYAGTEQGVWEFAADYVQPVPYEGVESDVHSLLWSDAGNLWVGTSEGLFRYSRSIDKWHEHPLVNGGVEPAIHCLIPDRKDRLWIGTDRGLVCWDSGKPIWITEAHGLLDTDIAGMIFDDGGYLWIGGNMGISRVSRDDLLGIVAGRQTTLEVGVYRESHGMASSEIAHYGQPSSWKDTEGRLWFATLRGLAMFDPQELLQAEKRPRVLIERFTATGRTLFGYADTVGDGNDLNAGETRQYNPSDSPAACVVKPGMGRVIEIRYTAPSFLAPEDVRFRCMLEGYDSEWRDVGQRRVASYTNLEPGDYRFRVMAANNLGLWNHQGAGLSFTVQPYFFQQKSFYVTCVLVLGVIILIIHLLRMRWLRQALRLEQEVVLAADRARIAKDMHDQMGGNLTQIAMLGQLARKNGGGVEQQGEALDRMVQTAIGVSKSMKELIWATNPRHDTLAGLLSHTGQRAIDFLAAAEIRCRLDFPDTIPELTLTGSVRNHLHLAAMEAVHNAVKHANPTEVWLRCRVTQPELILTIEDNGQGIANSTSTDTTAPTGNGLPNMRYRLTKIGGHLQIAKAPQKKQGTAIIMTVPRPNLGQ